MKPLFLYLIVLLSIHSEYSWSQNNQWLHKVRLGNIKTTKTTYNKYAGQESAATYDQILANPKIICDMPDCIVTHYNISIIPPGQDIYGPYSTNRDELSEKNIELIRNWKDTKKKLKIVIEDIHIAFNGIDEPLKGALFYECK